MKLIPLCICLLAFRGTPVESGEANLLDFNRVGPCDVTLTPEEPCEREEDDVKCPYQFNVPPLTIHLPKQLKDLERIVEELQMLKDSVDELRMMCADCTVRQTGRECDRESGTMSEGMNRNEDGRNWLNTDSLKGFSLEHGTKRVKSGNRSEGYMESDAGKMILEEKGKNKGGAESQSTTGAINEERRGDGRQVVEIKGTFHTQGATEHDKWTTNSGGSGKLGDLAIKSSAENNREGETDVKKSDMNGKEDSRGDGEGIPGDLKKWEKTKHSDPQVGQHRTKEMEVKSQSKENRSGYVTNVSDFHDEQTKKRQQQQHTDERKKEMEKGIKVERGNEKLKQAEAKEKGEASKKGEVEEKEESGQEIKTKGEKLVQGAQTDGDGGLASSTDTAGTNFASKGQTPSTSAAGPRQESADGHTALSSRSSHGPPASSRLTSPFPGVNKGLTTTAAGLQIQTAGLGATFIPEPGSGAAGRLSAASVGSQAGPRQQDLAVSTPTAPTPAGDFHGVVKPAVATATKNATVASLPGVSERHDSAAKKTTGSNTKTGMNPLPGPRDPRVKYVQINNSRKPDQGPLSDRKTKPDPNQKPPYHKPILKPRHKDPRIFHGQKPNQRTGYIPADPNLKDARVNRTVQNWQNIHSPKSPQKPLPPVQRPTSRQRNQPVKEVSSPDKYPPSEQRPQSTEIPNITQDQKISVSEKKRIHLLKTERTLKQSASGPELNQSVKEDRAHSGDTQATNFPPQPFPEPQTETLKNAEANPLAGAKDSSSGQTVTPSPILIKLPRQQSSLTPDAHFNHEVPEPKPRSEPNARQQALETPQRNQMPRLSSKPVSERNPEAESSSAPLSTQRSHTSPPDVPGTTSAERSTPPTPLKPISKTETDLGPHQMIGAALEPVRASQTDAPPPPGSAEPFSGVTLHPREAEVSSIKVMARDSKTFSSLEDGVNSHPETLSEDFAERPDSRITSHLKPTSIQATAAPNRETLGILPGAFHKSAPVSFHSNPKSGGEEDKPVQFSRPDLRSGSVTLATEQKAQILDHENQHSLRKPTGPSTDPLPETSRIDQNPNLELTTADGRVSEKDLNPDGGSAAPENRHKARLPPKPVQTPLTQIMENSVNSEVGSKPVLPGPKLDSRMELPQIEPKPLPAPKNGLNQRGSGPTADPEAEHGPEPDKPSRINPGFETPPPGPTANPVSDGGPGYDGIPSPLPGHGLPSTPTAGPGASSAQRSAPSFPLKSGSKPKTEPEPSQVTEETSDLLHNSQMTSPPSPGPVKLPNDVTKHTEVRTTKITTLEPKSSSGQDGWTIPRLHTLSGDLAPKSRVTSGQESQTTAAPPSIQMTDSPNRIIPRILQSVPPSDRPKQVPGVASELHHDVEETTKRQSYESNKEINTAPSSSSPVIRPTDPARPGPKSLAPRVSTDSARELRVKINQVAAFFNNSRSGRLPERHSPERSEDKQRGSRPAGINSKLLTRIPSKVAMVMRDCSDYLLRGETKSGVYIVTPDLRSKSFHVFCDMEVLGGGWTLLQRRQDGSVSFNRTWAQYRSGFGELDGGEFWLGNNVIHLLTRERDMMLRVELEDFEGDKGFAEYSQFRVASERLRYTLTVGGYSGNAGNALRFSRSYDHNQRAFTTPDRDHDRYPSGNCGAYYSSGWWFDACMAANLNGRYYTGRYKGVRDGIYWGTWHNISSEYYPTNDRQSFKSVRMMIRPRGFMSHATQP